MNQILNGMIHRQNFPKPLLLFILSVSVITILSACGDKQKDKDLKKAFDFHQEAIKIRKTAMDRMTELQANTDSLFLATYSDELKAIADALKEWDEQLVEVPGFEHDHSHHDHSGHDHDHDHDHHHNHSEQELTPQQHLEVQEHLLDEIKGLAQKLKNIKS